MRKNTFIAYYDAGCEKTIEKNGGISLANVFHKAGTLAAVGTYVSDNHSKLNIKIFDEASGELLLEQDEEFDFSGYYAIPLDDELDVENYRIEVTYDKTAPVEGEDWFDGFLRYKATINEGESFVKVGDKWLDLALDSTKKSLKINFKPNNACIKGIYS